MGGAAIAFPLLQSSFHKMSLPRRKQSMNAYRHVQATPAILPLKHVLSHLERQQLASFIEIAIELIDSIDGDENLEDDDGAEPDDFCEDDDPLEVDDC